MNQMMLTYIITALCGLFSISSIMYFLKNKRFIGRRSFTTIAAVIVTAMGLFAIIKGVPITQIQYLIESMAK